MDKQSEHSSQVLVVQHGARHRYAIPRLLEESGHLVALYIDSCAYSSIGRVVSILGKLGIRNKRFKALTSRIPAGVPSSKIFTSDRLLLNKPLGRIFRRWGLQGANVVYSMFGEDYDFLVWAKSQGARIVVDVFVHPGSNRIVAKEEVRLLGEADTRLFEQQNAHALRVFELADRLLCPSEWVADGVREFTPEHNHKIRIVPYGSSVPIAKAINAPESGRILFAGRESLRKGLHHLADAARLLRQAGLQIDVRVAGVAAEDIEWMEHRDELNCLGSVPMAQMKEEYAKADVFVLPSLTEGQAGVLLEAMACGCAVVATRESGVDFDPGAGVTVPVGDAVRLAREIKAILGDKAYRTSLATAALKQAERYSMDAWRARLVQCVEEL
jgi:glycosyltransferase involved in cell wall biosynthesis